MSGGIPDSRFVTGAVPPEMRPAEGLDDGIVARPTGRVTDADGVERQIMQVRVPRPDHIPAGPPKLSMPLADIPSTPSARALTYAFALLPEVQCQLSLTGPATADHLEQLVEYLSVACRKLREQEQRRGPKLESKQPTADRVRSLDNQAKDPSQTSKGEARPHVKRRRGAAKGEVPEVRQHDHQPD